MAVTMSLYNRFKANLANKEIDWEADTIKVALMTNSHSFDAAHNTWSQVSANEIAAGGGYSAGGASLANKAVTQAATTKLDADDTEWAASTITAYYAVIYDDSMPNKDLIASINFDGVKSSSSSLFKIAWNASGIITVT